MTCATPAWPADTCTPGGCWRGKRKARYLHFCAVQRPHPYADIRRCLWTPFLWGQAPLCSGASR